MDMILESVVGKCLFNHLICLKCIFISLLCSPGILGDERLREGTRLPHHGSGQEAVRHRHQQHAKKAGKVSRIMLHVAV